MSSVYLLENVNQASVNIEERKSMYINIYNALGQNVIFIFILKKFIVTQSRDTENHKKSKCIA